MRCTKRLFGHARGSNELPVPPVVSSLWTELYGAAAAGGGPPIHPSSITSAKHPTSSTVQSLPQTRPSLRMTSELHTQRCSVLHRANLRVDLKL